MLFNQGMANSQRRQVTTAYLFYCSLPANPVLYYGAITLHVRSQLFPYPELALALFVKITYFRRVCVCLCPMCVCGSVI